MFVQAHYGLTVFRPLFDAVAEMFRIAHGSHAAFLRGLDILQIILIGQSLSGEFAARRKSQALAWMWDIVHARLQTDFRHHAVVREALPKTLRDVTEARIAPSAAARTLLNLFERNEE